MPPSETDHTSLFLLEQYEADRWRFEIGARYEQQRTESTASANRIDHNLFSASGGAIFHLSEHLHINAALTRAQRAPTEEELFANGPHIATQTFELGDETLIEETSNNFEIGLRQHHGPFSGSITAFFNQFNDFIYLADTGDEEDGFPVRQWSQQDADLSGIEAEGVYTFAETDYGVWRINGMFDMVRAELDDGSDVPRTPPTRFGAGVDWSNSNWFAGLKVIRYDDQDRVAEFEEPTAGYTLVNADVSYKFNTNGSGFELYLKGRNLTDKDARNHTSFLKEVAPLPGRNFILGVRWRY